MTAFEGVDQKLFVKALAFEDSGGRKSVLITADNCAISADLTAAIAKQIEAKFGVGRNHLAICVTHTHSAPILKGAIENIGELSADEAKAVAKYTSFFADSAVAAAGEALGALAPATVSWGQGSAGFAANRRTPGGPADHDLPVLRVVGAKGDIRAIVFGYACHCTTLPGEYNRVHGDWAGCAQEQIESRHSGATAFPLIGCGADANPAPRTKRSMAEVQGREIVDGVDAVIGGKMKAIGGVIEGTYSTVALPFDVIPSKAEWEGLLASKDAPVRRRAKSMLDRIARDGQLAATYPYPVQTWSFGGDLTMILLGGEVVVDYSHRLKRDLDARRVWVTAYANDVMAYIPSLRVWEEGGYEAADSMLWYNQPARWAPVVEELIHEQIRKQVPEDLVRQYDQRAALAVDSPVTAGESLKYMEVEEGFLADVAASEPMIRDPVGVAWDARGQMYVTELSDYPEGPPSGRVIRLRDRDGDGVMDEHSVFVDGLAYVYSAFPYRDGLLVMAAPDILYVEDTDGDGRADVRKRLFAGFNEGNTQHRVNSMTWGLDNWVYGGNGDSTGTITSVTHPDRPAAKMVFSDFRFHTASGRFELVAGQSGFGQCFNDWGDRFTANSSGNIAHVVLDNRYFERNRFSAWSQKSQHTIGRVKVYPISGDTVRYNDPLDFGFFTAASGLAIYRGGMFPDAYAGNSFLGESAGNLVHRDALVEDGASFLAQANAEEREFLASKDSWFRPVYLTTGPDGGLYVADMYRAVIEHPEWIPDDIEATLSLKAGTDKGRIYRIRHRDRGLASVPNLAEMSAVELVGQLASRNGWVRDTAQRLLVERQDQAAIAPLRHMASGLGPPEGKVHALWALEGMNALEGGSLDAAIGNEHGRVREAGLRLAERRIVEGKMEPERFLAMANDADAKVRFRLACILGYGTSDAAADALANLLFDKTSDDWTQYAVMKARPELADWIMRGVVSRMGDSKEEEARMVPMLWRLSSIVGRRNDAEQIKRVAAMALPASGESMADWQVVVFGGGLVAGLSQVVGDPVARVRELVDAGKLDEVIGIAAGMLEDEKVPAHVRYDAERILALSSYAEHGKLLAQYLRPDAAVDLQNGAIEALSDMMTDEVSGDLLSNWTALAPPQRNKIIDGLFRRPGRILALLDAIEGGTVGVSDLDAGRKEQLLKHQDATIRGRAEPLLQRPTPVEREKVLAQYRSALELTGRRNVGEVLFKKNCAQCHPVQRVGPEVGPDLVRVRKREPAALLMDILDPNAAVVPNYVAYNVTTASGDVFTGLVVGQSAGDVTLRIAGGEERKIPREQIVEVRSSKLSLMPEDLEKALSLQDMADLIKYLRQIQ
jgi:putative membrane-bound dehydrogenase-like protein